MRALAIAAAFLVMGASPAYAQWVQPIQPIQPMRPMQPLPPGPHTTYDWQSGNTYTTTPTYGGGAQVQGFNTQTGSMWQQRIEPNGRQSGTDARGNTWTYDAQTGAYMSSDGHGCIGKGALRSCW